MRSRPTATHTRALDLLGQGLKVRQVLAQLESEGHKASLGSISGWSRAAKSASPDAEGDPLPRSARSSSTTPEALNTAGHGLNTSSRSSAPAQTGQGEAPDEWELSETDLVQLPAVLLERLAKRYAKRIASELDQTILDTSVLGPLVRDHERLTAALVRARPPIAVDPSADPTTREAAEVALAQVRRMVADLRQARQPPNCPAEPAVSPGKPS